MRLGRGGEEGGKEETVEGLAILIWRVYVTGGLIRCFNPGIYTLKTVGVVRMIDLKEGRDLVALAKDWRNTFANTVAWWRTGLPGSGLESGKGRIFSSFCTQVSWQIQDSALPYLLVRLPAPQKVAPPLSRIHVLVLLQT